MDGPFRWTCFFRDLRLPIPACISPSSAFRRSNVFIFNIQQQQRTSHIGRLRTRRTPLTLHDHAVLTFPTQLVHDHPGVSGSTLSFPSFQVDNQNARVVRIDMGGEIVPTIRRRAIGMDQKRKLVSL